MAGRRRGSRESVIVVCIVIVGFAALFCAAAPQPTVVFTQIPTTVLAGEDFRFVVEFSNPSPDLGYRPFIDLVLPAGGNDLNAPIAGNQGPCDGIHFVSVKLANPASCSAAPAPDCSCTSLSAGSSYWTFNLPHPALNYILVPNSNPIAQLGPLAHPYAQVNQQVLINSGDELVTIELPFANYSTHSSVGQPALAVEVTAHVHKYADVNVALPIRIRAGFRNGAAYSGSTATLSDPTPDSTVWAMQASVTPVPFQVAKACPASETATGESFSQAYTITVDVATGQTVQDLRVYDQLPSELYYDMSSLPAVEVYELPADVTSAIPNPCSGPMGLLFPVSVAQPAGGPGGTLTVFACQPVTGQAITSSAPMTDEVVIPFQAYVADNAHDAQCQPHPAVVTNGVSAVGNFLSQDPRDPSPQLFFGAANPQQFLEAKCLAVQKSVEVASDTNEPGPTPGDTLKYTLRFQLSDFRTVRYLVLEDALADGQHLLSTDPTLTISDWFDSYSGVFPTGTWNSAANSSLECPPGCGIKGGTLLTFDLSAALAAVSSDLRHQAGILTGGLAAGAAPVTPAIGEIVYYTQIDDTFSYPQAPGDSYLDKGDPILDCATIGGLLCTNEPVGIMPLDMATGIRDDGCSVISIVAGTLTKEVYAVKRNGNLVCCSCSTPDIWPGDDVTFRFQYTIPSGDAEHLSIRDWLPLPIFDVSDPDGGPCGSLSQWISAAPQPDLGLCATCSFLLPPPGWARCGVNHSQIVTVTGTLFAGPPPIGPLLGNGLGFDYSTLGGPYDTANEPKTIDYMYTLRVTNEPFADHVLLTNEVLECESNTLGDRFCQGALAPVRVREPELSIRKGVIATTNTHNVFTVDDPATQTPVVSPPTCPGGTISGPGSGCPRFSGTLASTNLSHFIGRDVSGVDASDWITFAIVVENTGGAPAYEIQIADLFPTGTATAPSCFAQNSSALCVTDGSGATLLYSLNTTGGGLVVLTLDSLPGTSAPPGKNVAVITFDVQLVDWQHLTAGCCDNSAQLLRYTSAADTTDCNQPNFVPGFGGPFQASAKVCVAPAIDVKCIQATSEPSTTPPPPPICSPQAASAAVGEIIRYRLGVVIPEGTTPKFQVTDHLPSGLTYIGNPSVSFVRNVPSVTTTPAFPWQQLAGNQLTYGHCLGAIPFATPLPSVAVTSVGSGHDVVFFVQSPNNPSPYYDVTNHDFDDDLELAIVEFNVQVDNVAANHAGTQLKNQFEVSYADAAGVRHTLSSSVAEVDIVEPALKATVSAAPATVMQGGTVTYTATIEHLSTSTAATAFDLDFKDVLPVGFSYVLNSLQCSGGVLQSNASSGNTISVTIDKLPLPLGSQIVLTYQATANSVVCCTPLPDAVAVTWTSLPGNYGTPTGSQNKTGQQVTGQPGSLGGERTGAGANPPNGYRSTAISSATVTLQCPCIPVPSGIVAWWPLDETTSTVVKDIVNGFDGTAMCTMGAPGPIGPFSSACDCTNVFCGPVSSFDWPIPTFPVGMVGNSLFFWSARHIDVPHAVALDPGTGSFTVDAWVIFAPAQNWSYLGIAQKGGGLPGTSNGWRFAVHDTSAGPKLTFDLLTPAGGGGVVAPISLGWHHVAATMQRQPSNVVLTLFIDGSAVSTATVLGVGANVNIGSSNDLFIGRSDGVAAGEFALDEVEIFNRVLTAQEIYDIMCSGKCKPDLGDAPDSTSSAASVIMYAYTGVVGNFPTVFNSSGPRGPIHRNATGLSWLGTSVSLEGEADTGWDQDLGMLGHNISPTLGTADSDGSDDGVGPITLTSCTSMSFPFTATSVGTSSAYINVWFDWNRDGDWNDVVTCPFDPTVVAPERAVANYPVTLNPGFNDVTNNSAMTTPPFTSIAPSPGQATWMRVSLTDVPVASANSDGSGPVNGYAYGETEDYLIQPCCTPRPTGDFVAWWPLDESAGPTAHDLAGAANDGAWSGSPAAVAGMVAGGLQFDGVDDYVQVPDDAELDVGAGNFSIDAWVYLQVGGVVHTLVDKRSQAGGWHGYLLFVDTYNHLCLQLADGSATNYWSDVVVTPGQWHHVAVTVSRSSSTGIQWYLDGSQIPNPDDPTLHPGSLDNTGPLLLGKNAGTAYWLHGILDEVEIFRRILTPSEVKDIFAAGSCGKCK